MLNQYIYLNTNSNEFPLIYLRYPSNNWYLNKEIIDAFDASSTKLLYKIDVVYTDYIEVYYWTVS